MKELGKKNIILASINKQSSGQAKAIYSRANKAFKDYNIIKEYGENFGETKPSPDNVLCLAMHGNREVPIMSSRFEFLDSICNNVWCVMGTPIRGWMSCDRNGYSGASSIAKDHSLLRVDEVSDEDASAMHKRLFEKFVETNSSKYEQPEFAGLDHLTKVCGSQPFILVLGQVAGDSVINFTNFPAPKHKIRGLVRPPHARRDTPAGYINSIIVALSTIDKFNIPIIYKPHPLENQDANAVINNLIGLPVFNNVSIVSDASIHELLPLAKAVVTINSGSGFEALIHLKPVVTLGRVDYSAATYECRNIEDIKKSEQFINSPVDELKIKKFLCAYLNRAYECPMDLIRQILP